MCLHRLIARRRRIVMRPPWVALLPAAALLFVGLAGCTGSTAAPASSSSSASPTAVAFGDSPPAWVLDEALWQSLAAGDQSPQSLQWALTTPSRASGLDPGAKWLKVMRGVDWKIYAVVVNGDFALPGYGEGPQHARALLMLIETQSGAYIGLYHSLKGYDLAGLQGVHTYRPAPRVTAGIWGHTFWAGGPAPGGPHPLGRVAVEVFAGGRPRASDKPVTSLTSDARGLFTLALAPGKYTFLFRRSSFGPSQPTTVTVHAGRPLAVGVYASVP